jgi:peptide/nickel transport system permease protein
MKLLTRVAPNAIVGSLIMFIVLGGAALGALWTPYDPLALDFAARFSAPNAAHWLGTDEFGRDELSRLMAGAGSSAWISFVSVTSAVLAGTTLGVLTGYLRGAVDRVVMACNDALLAFPGILLALGLLTVFGANRTGIIAALAFAYTPSVTRIVRAAVLSLREREFVDASRVMGNSELFTMLRHIVPNCVAPITVLATSMFGWALLSESALSFLGLGVPPPAPTWGNMLAESRQHVDQAVWLGIFPGLCISLTLLGINLLGDAVRDRLDPRMRGAR